MPTTPLSLLVAVPVYGQHHLTHTLISDLHREQVDFVIVDNRGDYLPLGDEWVVRPPTNLGWAGGSNLGLRLGFAHGYHNAMTLNNDVRVSRGYFDGLLDPRLPANRGLVCGLYDDPAQRALWPTSPVGDAADYTPQRRYRPLSCADGTGLMMTRDLWVAIGGLDDRSFGRFAWGADIDLSIRAHDAGFGIYATEMSFLNHFGRQTARRITSNRRYAFFGGTAMSRGLWRVHGARWKDTVVTAVDSTDLDTGHVIQRWTLDDIANAHPVPLTNTAAPQV